MKLSIVIPAYNEERYLPATLDAINSALAGIEDSELIVVDNGSTDATPELARSAGARLVSESIHNIGAVRNTGAKAAAGEVIVFIDADTIVRPGVFEAILDAVADPQCIGGSVSVLYEEPANRPWMRFFMRLWTVLGHLTKMRQGALQFCRPEVFRELNGYDETIYVGEDIDFHWRMDRLADTRGGRTEFVEESKVTTSSRRWEKMGLWRMLFFTHPVTIFLAWRRESVWKDWYKNAIR